MIPFADLAPVDIQRELAAMRADVAELRRAQADGWMDEARAEQVRTVVRSVLDDSGTRASFADAGATIDLSQGFGVRSADGCWSARLTLIQQVRFVWNSAYGSPNSSYDENTRWGMENVRTNLRLDGTVLDPSIDYTAMFTYQTQADRYLRVPDTLRVQYAMVTKWWGKLGICVGAQNVPWDLESAFMGSSRLTLGDYSVFNYRFGLGKNPGVTLHYQDDSFRVTAGTFSQLTVLTDTWNQDTNSSWAVTSRTEWKIGADWKELEYESGSRTDRPGAVLGLGVCWSGGSSENPQPPVVIVPPPAGYVQPTPAAAGFTADVRATLSGAVAIAQVAVMRDPVGSPELGWYVGTNFQLSGFLTETVEGFVEACWMDDVQVPWIAEAGVNVYLAGRASKLTVKAIVPFGGGWVGGIESIAGGLGIAKEKNNASLVAQLQLTY